MAWYWWVLIAVGVVALGVLKIKVWNKILENRKQKKQRMEQDE